MARIATLNTESKSVPLTGFSYSIQREWGGYKVDGEVEVSEPAPGVVSFTIANDDDAFFFQKSGSKTAVLAGSITIKDQGEEKMRLEFEGGRIVSFSATWGGDEKGGERSQGYSIVLRVKLIKRKNQPVPAT